MSATLTPPPVPATVRHAPTGAGSPSSPPRRRDRRALLDVRRWPTPRRLQALLALTWLTTFLFGLATIAALGQLQQGVQTIGRDSAPSIVAAQTIRAALADMDAQNATDLLGGADGVASARATFEHDRQVVSGELIRASENITYGDDERVPIRAVQDGLGTYLQLVEQARVYHQLNPAQDNADMVRAYRAATDLLHGQVLPAVDRLDAVNQGYLNSTYGGYRTTAGRAAALVYASGGALLALLIGTQLFLTRRTRRLLHIPLVAASLVVAIALVALIAIFGAAQENVRGIKQDAFDSLGILWRGKALAYDLNGDQLRFLLDPDPARQSQYTGVGMPPLAHRRGCKSRYAATGVGGGHRGRD